MSRTAEIVVITENLALAVFLAAIFAAVAMIAREILSSWYWPAITTFPRL
jgi:hypothetical protein